ncbi:MAG: hypothetical protein WCF30_02530 [Terracidiphilus sp.]
MAVLQFKFDESFDGRVMTVGGWIGEEREWRRLENQWQRCIDRQNSSARQDQQISRFHAAEMNGYKEEFAHWDKPMSERFCGKLVNLLTRRQMGGICIGADMDAIKAVFPEDDPNRRDSVYALCIKQAMVEIGHIMQHFFPGDQVALIHDHGDWDEQALAGYNKMVDDPQWISRKYFHSITPLTWRQSIGLQPADMLAYEAFKALSARIVHDEERFRWALRQFISEDGMPMMLKYMSLDTIRQLREKIDQDRANQQSGTV